MLTLESSISVNVVLTEVTLLYQISFILIIIFIPKIDHDTHLNPVGQALKSTDDLITHNKIIQPTKSKHESES